MRILLIFFFVGIFFSCSSSDIDRDSKGKDAILEKKVESPKNSDIPNHKIIDTIKIFANLKIDSYSMDSIVATVIFNNEESREFVLYKPILPSDSLFESTFSVLDEHGENLPHTRADKNRKYLFGKQNLLPGIIPDLSNENNLIVIKPKEKLIFKINIAKHYDFNQSGNKAKRKKVSVAYVNLLPYILDQKQMMVPYTEHGMTGERPVYFLVQSSPRWSEITLPL